VIERRKTNFKIMTLLKTSANSCAEYTCCKWVREKWLYVCSIMVGCINITS